MRVSDHRVPPTLIVGTGLIGSSIGLSLRQAGTPVWLSDRNRDAVVAAMQMGAGEDAANGGLDPGLVVVAVPPSGVVDAVLGALRDFPDATVCDVASSKAAIVANVNGAAGSSAARFIGTHPMAGSEVSGPLGARSDLFVDRRWVITPDPRTGEEAIGNARALAEACGSVVIELSAAAHDHAVALTSHLPQVVASALAARLAEAPIGDVIASGQGLRDTTRIADSDPELWADILCTNGKQVAPLLDDLIRDLAEVRDEIGGPVPSRMGRGRLIRLLRRGNEGRSRLPDKHGGAAAQYGRVTVFVADQPGELARLFADAGAAHVNIEDVRIEHSIGRARALVELAVQPDIAGTLREVLGAGGWSVSVD